MFVYNTGVYTLTHMLEVILFLIVLIIIDRILQHYWLDANFKLQRINRNRRPIPIWRDLNGKR
jgi:hypothetical protein